MGSTLKSSSWISPKGRKCVWIFSAVTSGGNPQITICEAGGGPIEFESYCGVNYEIRKHKPDTAAYERLGYAFSFPSTCSRHNLIRVSSDQTRRIP